MPGKRDTNFIGEHTFFLRAYNQAEVVKDNYNQADAAEDELQPGGCSRGRTTTRWMQQRTNYNQVDAAVTTTRRDAKEEAL